MADFKTVTLGGKEIMLEPFSGFKAIFAIDTVGAVEGTVRQLVGEQVDFKAAHTARVIAGRSKLTFSRVEARRQFRPEPLYEQVDTDDGPRLIAVLKDGVPVMGPDPLGHVTEADWQASGNQLVIPQIPRNEDTDIDNAVMLAMVPRAFKEARATVLRLVALVMTSNRDLEEWDGAGADIDAQLDAAAKKTMHRADAAELIALVVAAVELARDQIAGPFGDAVEAIRGLFPQQTATAEGEAPPQQPMTIEPVEPVKPAETTSSQGSSTSSPASTDGRPETSSTAPAGDSS